MKKTVFGIYHPLHKVFLLALDLLAIYASFFVASNVRLGIVPNFISIEFIGLSLIVVLSLFLGNGYTSSTLDSRPRLPLKTFFVVLAAAAPAMLFIYSLGPDRFNYLFGRGIFPVAMVATGLLAMANRLVLNFVFGSSGGGKNILMIGDLRSKAHFDNAISSSAIKLQIDRIERLLPNKRLNQISAIVISPEHVPKPDEQQALISARLSGVPIFSLSDFFENFLFLVPVNEINDDWLIRAHGFTMLHSTVAVRVKRAVDAILASILLLFSVPLMMLVALLIKLSSRGPVLFSQQRVGYRGEVFTLHKFRTMRLGAEDAGARWASDRDERVFPLGRLLRKTRIDELPQCWNILKGEMSLIGPRPERPEFTSHLAQDIPYYEFRHLVKPGLTGWAQVCFRYGASTDDALRKLQYDLYYIKNYSLLLDLNILLRTLQVSFRLLGR